MSISTVLPRYICHKQVSALKIARIDLAPATPDPNTGSIIIPAEPGYAPVAVPKAYIDKFKPENGGYYVVYDDGYASYSPAKPFEEGYTRIFVPTAKVLKVLDVGPTGHQVMLDNGKTVTIEHSGAGLNVGDELVLGPNNTVYAKGEVVGTVR
jgi:hypothetical protein